MWRKSETVVVEWRRSGEGSEGPDCPGHDFLLPGMTQLQSISLSTQSIHISNSPTRPFGLLITVWTRFPSPLVIHKCGLIQSISRNFIYNTSQRVPVCLCGSRLLTCYCLWAIQDCAQAFRGVLIANGLWFLQQTVDSSEQGLSASWPAHPCTPVHTCCPPLWFVSYSPKIHCIFWTHHILWLHVAKY